MQWWKLSSRVWCNRKVFWLMSLCFLIFLWIIIIIYLSSRRKEEVVILIWSYSHFQFRGLDLMKLIDRRKEYDETCYDGVEITLDREQLQRATAIVMYHQQEIPDLPRTRREDQLWVLYEVESLHYSFSSLKPFNNLFNWTMTYRKDSDIFAPYGYYFKLDKEKEKVDVNGVSLDDFIARKNGEFASVVSNCQTPGGREEFLSKINKDGIMPVDIYGACGKSGMQLCHRSNLTCDHGKWWAELGAKYKFYFAGENSLCPDYITEKFWRSLEIGAVPVVYGGANYSLFAPPHSFIDARDFKSAKDVANFLRRLDKDETEYKKYFEWRKKYKVRWVKNWQWQGFCELSKRVKGFREKLDRNPKALQDLSKTIKDIDWWWAHKARSNEGACDSPSILF